MFKNPQLISKSRRRRPKVIVPANVLHRHHSTADLELGSCIRFVKALFLNKNRQAKGLNYQLSRIEMSFQCWKKTGSWTFWLLKAVITFHLNIQSCWDLPFAWNWNSAQCTAKFSCLRLASALMDGARIFLVEKDALGAYFFWHILTQNACILISVSCASALCVLPFSQPQYQ